MDLIKSFIENYYPWLLGLLAGGTSFLLPVTKQVWVIILRAMLTKKAAIRVFIHIGDWVTGITKTKIDDELWALAKEDLEKEL